MTFEDKVLAAIREHELVTVGETVVVGVSGGPDSLVLLHVLNAISPELGIQLYVAHLDHQLRGSASDADAAFVAEIARTWGLPAAVEAHPVAEYARLRHLSLEEAARVVRYRFLAETAARVGARRIAVAHNADDQAETVLMHLLRGSGLAGLRGMAYVSSLPSVAGVPAIANSPLTLIRPLLGIPRVEIQAYCDEQDLRPRYDASNDETRFWRNRLRHQVIPYLERFNPRLREILNHTAESIADDYDYMRGQLLTAFDAIAHPDGNALVLNLPRWRELPPSLQRATLREAVRRLRRELRNINWVHIEAARRVAHSGKVGARATLPGHLLLAVGYDTFSVGESVPRPDWPLLFDEPLTLHLGESVKLPGTAWVVRVTEEGREAKGETYEFPRAPRWTITLDADKVRGALSLRRRRTGDRFQPRGLGGHDKTLHDFMINEKIPRHMRDLVPLLCDQEKILWVCGFRQDERASVRDVTTRRLHVEFVKG